MDQTYINWILGVLGAMMGFLLNAVWQDVKDLQTAGRCDLDQGNFGVRGMKPWYKSRTLIVNDTVAVLEAPFGSLADPRTEGGFNSLVESGLLTQARRDEIITKMQ